MPAGSRVSELLAAFGSARGVYEATNAQRMMSGTVSARALERMQNTPLSTAEKIISQCKANDWKIVTYDDKNYNERFRQIVDPPLVLYVWGDETALAEELSISVVGTRQCSEYGLGVAYNLSYDLAKAGAMIVSGGALGIDRKTHEGALDAGGRTVAFLGCGLGYNYLKSNGDLRMRISKNGAVVSEYLPYFPASRNTFPIRNRLISAQSLGTLVIEAGEKSGSLITAHTALDQNKDVFAVPVNIDSALTGTNTLIQSGAKPVNNAWDILVEYESLYPGRINFDGTKSLSRRKVPSSDAAGRAIRHTQTRKEAEAQANSVKESSSFSETSPASVNKEKKELPLYASKNAAAVYDLLSETPVLTDDLAELAGLGAGEILSALTELELLGLASECPGGRYTINA